MPRGVDLPPLALVFTPTYGDRNAIPPSSFAGHAYLHVAQDGAVSGSLSAGAEGHSFLAAVTGRVEDRELVLDAGSMFYVPQAELSWDELHLFLLDQDGDGEIDGATGDAAGEWGEIDGDVVLGATYTATIAANRDEKATSATLGETGARLPFGALEIQLGEPVRRAELDAKLRVLANGVPIAGTFDEDRAVTLPPSQVDDLVTRVRFQPTDFLPFDQAISLDPGGLRDPSGNAITAAASSLRVIPDPGPATANLGFENGLSGWTAFDAVFVIGEHLGISPAEGDQQAAISQNGTLAGYLDLPADATALHVAVTMLADLERVSFDYPAVAAVHGPGGELIGGFDASDAVGNVVACTACGRGFGFQFGPVTRDLDVTSLRGVRVWMTFEARAFLFTQTLYVDDVRVVTATN